MAVEFPAWTWVFGLFVGAAIGSFLNVCIYRLPLRLSLSKPPNSFCPKCKHKLGIPDLIPLFSWLGLRGKCRHCKAPISPRYFIVELVNGAIWAYLWWQYLIVGNDWVKGLAFALFSSALLVAILTDLEHYVIPEEVNAFLLFVGFGYNAVNGTIMTAVWGALTGFGLLWGIAFLGRVMFGKDAMGHGDIIMARGMGAMLGPLLMGAALGIAVVVGLFVGLATVAIRARASRGNQADDDDEPYIETPETLGSLLKSGVGYLLCLDVLALFWKDLDRIWFGIEQQISVEEDDWQPGLTHIPFGPYLAIGAMASAVFADPLTRILTEYFSSAGGQPVVLEHLFLTGGPKIV